jgi:uncharacterized surface protein with fasciclin (FAS1) repeats
MSRILSVIVAGLFLLFGSNAYAASQPARPDTVYDLMKDRKDLDKFMDMVSDADLKDLLKSSGTQVTVFAPTDDAIGDIPRAVRKRIESSKANLQSFVKYHIISGSFVSSSAINGRKSAPATDSGELLLFDGTGKNLKAGEAVVIEADLHAANGIVHIVNGPIVPPSLMADQAEAPSAPERAPAPTPVAAAPAPSLLMTTTAQAVKTLQTTTTLQATTTGKKGLATTSSTYALPATTSTYALPATTSTYALPATTSTYALPTTSSTAALATTSTAAALPATSSPSGFQLFGHKFGW